MRCGACGGTGYTRYAEAVVDRAYCTCPLGVDLQRVDAKIERQRVAVERELAEFNARPKVAHLKFGADFKARASGESE